MSALESERVEALQPERLTDCYPARRVRPSALVERFRAVFEARCRLTAMRYAALAPQVHHRAHEQDSAVVGFVPVAVARPSSEASVADVVLNDG